MNIQDMTMIQIREAGLEILLRELGPAGMVRFLQQYESGTGDYTKERSSWLTEKDVQSLAEKIIQNRKISE